MQQHSEKWLLGDINLLWDLTVVVKLWFLSQNNKMLCALTLPWVQAVYRFISFSKVEGWEGEETQPLRTVPQKCDPDDVTFACLFQWQGCSSGSPAGRRQQCQGCSSWCGSPCSPAGFKGAKWRCVFMALCGNLSEEAAWFSWQPGFPCTAGVHR